MGSQTEAPMHTLHVPRVAVAYVVNIMFKLFESAVAHKVSAVRRQARCCYDGRQHRRARLRCVQSGQLKRRGLTCRRSTFFRRVLGPQRSRAPHPGRPPRARADLLTRRRLSGNYEPQSSLSNGIESAGVHARCPARAQPATRVAMRYPRSRAVQPGCPAFSRRMHAAARRSQRTAPCAPRRTDLMPAEAAG